MCEITHQPVKEQVLSYTLDRQISVLNFLWLPTARHRLFVTVLFIGFAVSTQL